MKWPEIPEAIIVEDFGRKRGELEENSHKTKENKYIKLR